MKWSSTFLLLVSVSLYNLLTAASCKPDPIEPPIVNKSIAELVEGNYSGNGLYMPSNVPLGPKTNTCLIPDWQSFLKSGTGIAKIVTLTETSIKITLSGSVYATPLNLELELEKSGNVISDSKNIVRYFISSGTIEIAFSSPVIGGLGGGCNPVNKYYYIFEGPISVPPTPRYSYTSIASWEFEGKK